MDITKKPYEISLWEDVLVFVVEDLDGNREEFEEFVPDYVIGKVVAQYYKEQKICVIGSDTMSSAIRAVQGKLNSKVNGENILTFNMYSHYYDSELEQQIENPFIKLLINERKIKLRHGAPGAEDVQWYDLVIKSIQENSDTKTYTYTAKNQFVNELSKSGFNLQLDSQLENNMGNVNDLGKFIISETDWELKTSDEILKEAIEEPLYKVILNKTIGAMNMETNEVIEIEQGAEIFVFYSIIVDKNPYVQFIYEDNYETDSDYVITDASNWAIDSVKYLEDGKPEFAQVMEISDEYRGKRLVRKGITKFDSAIDKYVKVYKNYDGSEIYGYTEQEYTSPTAVVSYVTNPNNFDSTIGWDIGGISHNGEVAFPDLEFVTVPDIRDVPADSIDEINFIPCLKLKVTQPGQVLYNTGIIDNRHNISNFTQGEKYVFKVKYGQAGSFSSKNRPTNLVDTDTGLIFDIAKYQLNNGVYELSETYFHGELSSSYTGSEPDYKYVIVECQKSLTYKEMISMTKTLGLFVKPVGLENGAIYIEDLQFFKYIGTIDALSGPPLEPGSIHEGKIETIYYY